MFGLGMNKQADTALFFFFLPFGLFGLSVQARYLGIRDYAMETEYVYVSVLVDPVQQVRAPLVNINQNAPLNNGQPREVVLSVTSPGCVDSIVRNASVGKRQERCLTQTN